MARLIVDFKLSRCVIIRVLLIIVLVVALFASAGEHEAQASYVLAASDSTSADKARADEVCTGDSDNLDIESALSSYRSVTLLAGTYDCNANISVPANTEFIGSGWATVLVFDDGGAGDVDNGGAITIAGDNVRIANLKATLSTGCGTATKRPNLIASTNTARNHVTIENVWLIGDESVGDDGSIARQNGIVVKGTDWVVSNCRSDSNYRNGILFYVATFSKAIGNSCIHNANQGIQLFGSDNNIVDSNICRFSGDHSIFLYHADGNIVSGNIVDSGTGNQLYIWRGSNNVVTGNISRNGYQDGIALKGDSTEPCNYNLISNNNSTDNTLWGIRILGGSYTNCNSILFNEVHGNSNSIYDGGTNTCIYSRD